MDLDIDAVYAGLAAAINDAELQGATQKVTATEFAPEALSVPHFFPAEFTADYDKTFGGLTELIVIARLMLSRADDKAGQAEARRLASAGQNTIRAALRAARGEPGEMALGGAADDVHLRRAQGPRLYEYGEHSYYGLEFTIFVMG